jgi:hypothetical protein
MKIADMRQDICLNISCIIPAMKMADSRQNSWHPNFWPRDGKKNW